MISKPVFTFVETSYEFPILKALQFLHKACMEALVFKSQSRLSNPGSLFQNWSNPSMLPLKISKALSPFFEAPQESPNLKALQSLSKTFMGASV